MSPSRWVCEPSDPRNPRRATRADPRRASRRTRRASYSTYNRADPSAAHCQLPNQIPLLGELGDTLPRFLEGGGAQLVAEVTYHEYPLVGAKFARSIDPWFATPERAVHTDTMARVDAVADTVQAIAMEHNVTVTMGEGALSSFGGVANVSDAFASVFAYATMLGGGSLRGHAAVIRQCFSGANYGLVAASGEPNPDFYVALLFQRLMLGGEVANATLSGAPASARGFAVRAHGSLTLLLSNPSDASLEVDLDDDLGAATDLWALTAPSLTSRHMLLNGKVLVGLPPLDPVTPVNPRQLPLPAHSLAFVRLAGEAA